eukprot:1189631-Prorocentrum_minimum.AAC.1
MSALRFTGPPVPITARVHSTPQRPFRRRRITPSVYTRGERYLARSLHTRLARFAHELQKSSPASTRVHVAAPVVARRVRTGEGFWVVTSRVFSFSVRGVYGLGFRGFKVRRVRANKQLHQHRHRRRCRGSGEGLGGLGAAGVTGRGRRSGGFSSAQHHTCVPEQLRHKVPAGRARARQGEVDSTRSLNPVRIWMRNDPFLMNGTKLSWALHVVADTIVCIVADLRMPDA